MSPKGLWFENFKLLPKIPDLESGNKLDSKCILEKKTRAKNLYDAQVAKFDQGFNCRNVIYKHHNSLNVQCIISFIFEKNTIKIP